MTNPSRLSVLVKEVRRFAIEAHQRKAEELAHVGLGAESDAAELNALSLCLRQDVLVVLGQELETIAEGAPLYGVSEALEGFGPEADALRLLLAEHEAAAAE